MDEVLVVRHRGTEQPQAAECDNERNLYVNLARAVALAITGPVTVVQPVHNLLNANANVQMQDADVEDDNPLRVLLRATDGAGNYWNVTIDAATMAMTIIPYEHHEIHEGSHFFVAGYTTLALNATIEFVVTVPDATKWPHMKFVWGSSNILTVEMFEGPTTVVGGTPVTPENSNRNSLTASGLTIVSDPASIGTDGALIWSASWGSKQSGGMAGRDDEIILKQDTAYLWRATSGANSNVVTYEGLWYEHTSVA